VGNEDELLSLEYTPQYTTPSYWRVIEISAVVRVEATLMDLKRGAGISTLAIDGMAVGVLTLDGLIVGLIDGLIEGIIVRDNEGF
jgi:hypothetical protein